MFLINRLPSKSLNQINPYQQLYNKKPDYAQLKVFDCNCFPYLRAYNHHKLDNQYIECVSWISL